MEAFFRLGTRLLESIRPSVAFEAMYGVGGVVATSLPFDSNSRLEAASITLRSRAGGTWQVSAGQMATTDTLVTHGPRVRLKRSLDGWQVANVLAAAAVAAISDQRPGRRRSRDFGGLNWLGA
jgi:hypothetical protein